MGRSISNVEFQAHKQIYNYNQFLSNIKWYNYSEDMSQASQVKIRFLQVWGRVPADICL